MMPLYQKPLHLSKIFDLFSLKYVLYECLLKQHISGVLLILE